MNRRQRLITTCLTTLILLLHAGTLVSQQAGSKQRTREPAVAGLFYPSDPAELEQLIDILLEQAAPPTISGLRGLVCPHAGYRYSGPTAAYGYKLLQDHQAIDTAIVLAPSHYAAFQGASVPDVDDYLTPLGRIPLAQAASILAGRIPFSHQVTCRVQRPGWWRQSPIQPPPPA